MGVEEEEEDGEIQVGRVLAMISNQPDKVNRVQLEPPLEAVTEDELREAMQKDQLMCKLVKAVQTGQGRSELLSTPYRQVLDELSYAGGVLVRGGRVLIPDELQARVVALAHEGHLGIEPTLRYLRDKVWFPDMNKMVQDYISSCLGCGAAVPFNPPAPIITRAPPGGPWKVCCADYKGPIGGTRGYYFHVLIDTYSKWPEVSVTKSTKFVKLFPALDKSFACHGYPDKIIHDGGPPYNSEAWKGYAKQCGFETDLCTPEHPQANGQAEKFMSSIVKITHASIAEGKDPKEEIYKFLMIYRNTPHSSTGQTPASLMMNRGIKTKIPSIIKTPTFPQHQKAQEQDAISKAKQKAYADKHRRAKDKKFEVGDTVLLHQKKTTTKPPFNPDPYTVTEVRDTKITAERRGEYVTRNVDKWKILKDRPRYLRTTTQQNQQMEDEDSDSDFECDLPKRTPDPPPPQARQEAPQEAEPQPELQPQVMGAHVAAPRQARAGIKERWIVAMGPQNQEPHKTNSPSPRERKRRQQAARKRDKEQKDHPYWLRGRDNTEEDLEEEEDEN